MLWWDDGFGRKKSQDQQTHITQNGQNGGKEGVSNTIFKIKYATCILIKWNVSVITSIICLENAIYEIIYE